MLPVEERGVVMREDFGAELRRRRERLGLSLRAVASEVGVSASMLSQVETGKLFPSVTTLYHIAAFLDVSLDFLLGLNPHEIDGDGDGAQPSPVQRAEDNPRIEIEHGVTWERLASKPDSGIQPLLVTYEPGATSSADERLLRHSGLEHGYLLKGQLVLRLEFDHRIIRAGDSFCFSGEQPHLFVNKGEKPAKGIWFVAPDATDQIVAGSETARTNSHPNAVAMRALRDSI